MDDLISRKAVLDFMNGWKGETIEYVRNLPSVPAVPMDKLCEILAKNADCPPEHSPVQDHCIQAKCAECWKSVLEEWMEEQRRCQTTMKVICKRTGNICEMCKLGLIPDITKCKYREEVQEDEQKHDDDYK